MELINLKIGNPARQALKNIGVYTLEDCCHFTRKELLAIHGVGPKAISIIEEECIKNNISLKK